MDKILRGGEMIGIFNEDCMDLMSRYPDKHFDLAIVDPPFLKGPSTPEFYWGKKSKPRGKYAKTEHWDIPDQDYYNELIRVSKNQIIFGINYLNFQGVPPGRIVWDKKNDKSTYSDGEIASCSLITSVRFFRYLWMGFVQEKKNDFDIRIHPTQKPVLIYKWILDKFGKPGWNILDTHLGSGSIAIACYDMGFNLTAAEIDETIYSEAIKRIKDYSSQGVFNFGGGGVIMLILWRVKL